MKKTNIEPGHHFAGFVLKELIGSGATGRVFRAEAGDKEFAIKVIECDDVYAKRRFLQGARALDMLRHPNIVEMEAHGFDGSHAFLVTELLKGETLASRHRRAVMEPKEAVAVIIEVLKGLSAAHEAHVLHRDLKPANVFLCETGEVKLLDFGLSKILSCGGASEHSASSEGQATERGHIVGTPAYMAPEQVAGDLLDARLDVYAAGVVLFELLADRRPFVHEKRSGLLRAHLFDPVPRLEDAARQPLPEALLTAVTKALDKDRTERWQSADEFRQALVAVEGLGETAAAPRGEHAQKTARAIVLADAERELAARIQPTESGRVTALVWLLSLLAFFLAAGVMVYAAVMVRE